MFKHSPYPKPGPHRIQLMTIQWHNKYQQLRVLLGSGSSVPMLSSKIVNRDQVPQFEQSTLLVVEWFDVSMCPDIGYL
jgi:hypothetical protein